MSILDVLEQHGYGIHKHQRLPLWEVTVQGHYWAIAQKGDRFYSAATWLQQWIDSLATTTEAI